MTTVTKILCLALLLSMLGLSASATSDDAAAVTPTSTAGTTPNQDYAVASQDDRPPLHFDHLSTEQGIPSLDV
jgi:hypothetical protein